MTITHTITIYPTKRGLYDVVLDATGETLLRDVRTPLLSASRALLGRAEANPSDHIEMKREGQPVALSSTLGSAAGLTVVENANEGPIFAPHRSRSLWAEHE